MDIFQKIYGIKNLFSAILSVIDMAEPYLYWPYKKNIINVEDKNNQMIEYDIGGSITINSVEVYYTYPNKNKYIKYPTPKYSSQVTLENFYSKYTFKQYTNINIDNNKRPQAFSNKSDLLIRNTFKFIMDNPCCNLIFIKYSVDQGWNNNVYII